jgi:MATE family, multidrug efflux pump
MTAAGAKTKNGPRSPSGVYDMTRGSIRGHVVRMMVFVLTGLAIQTLYGLVDIYWVGRLGKEAIAAVALSSNLMFVSLAVTQILSVGCVALVSQATGRKEHDEVQRLFNKAQSLSTCAGVMFFAIGLATKHTYATRLSGDETTAALAEAFLDFFVPALALQFTMVGLGSALRGIGDMKPGLVAQMGSVVLNMILAPFLIFGWIGAPRLGVAGAGLATLVATVAAIGGLMIYLLRGKTFLRLRVGDWRPDANVWGRMIRIGLPAGLEFLLLSITMGVAYALTARFGAPAQAGFGIGGRIMQVGFMPSVALSFSAAAVVGQNYGAGDRARVRETLRESVMLVVVFMIVFTIVCQVAPATFIGLFTADPTVIASGVDYLSTVSANFVAAGVVFVVAGVFQGLGNTWPSLAASTLRAVVFVAPAVWISRSPGFRMHSLWQLLVLAALFQLALCIVLIRRELRLKVPIEAS